MSSTSPMPSYDNPTDARDQIRINVRCAETQVEVDVAHGQTIGETKLQLQQLGLPVNKLRLNDKEVSDSTTIAELCALHNEPLVFHVERQTLEVSVRRRKRCSASKCSSAPLRGVGDCASCGGNFCSRHRLMEQHQCSGLQGCKQQMHERNAVRLQEQQTVGNKVHATLPCPLTARCTILYQIQKCTVLLKDKETTATLFPITSVDQVPVSLLYYICDEFNMEIEAGSSTPIINPLHAEVFRIHWFGSFAAVLLLGDVPGIPHTAEWQRECLGSFFIKPNFPGRSAHICTGEFIVNSHLRNKGIGKSLVEKYLEWAPKLGYSQVMFNLVYETNAAARQVLESLKFRKIGRIKGAGILKDQRGAVDAFIYGQPLTEYDPERVTDLRFDRIKYYLETGLYPQNMDRQGKSRLRSSSAAYRLEHGKLLLKDREVVAEPEAQLALALKVHRDNEHVGVNKTTTLLAEKYHWIRIKDTVAAAIKACGCNKSELRYKRPRLEQSEELDLNQFYPIFEQSTEELAIADALMRANGDDEGAPARLQSP